jgi:hypothetical protein
MIGEAKVGWGVTYASRAALWRGAWFDRLTCGSKCKHDQQIGDERRLPGRRGVLAVGNQARVGVRVLCYAFRLA